MDQEQHFTPWRDLPDDLVRPSRVDPSGITGPTRGQTQRGRWRRSAQGWYVPSAVDGTRVEQRILEQGMRVRTNGAVTGWASLRWRGAAYFDGRLGRRDLPVELMRLSGGRTRQDPRGKVTRYQLPPYDREFVRGIWCTTTERAVFDEVRRLRHSLRPCVVAICMALAARLTTLRALRGYAEIRVAWEGVPMFRDALKLCNECFRSPPEVWLYLRWVLDAALPTPLVNPPVFDLSGRLLGYPDLFDPVAGVVGEYDGLGHRSRDRHRSDVVREGRFRDAGLEYFTVVAGDLAERSLVVDRIHRTRSRAGFLPPEQRLWTLTPPPWWVPPPWLPDRYLPTQITGPAA